MIVDQTTFRAALLNPEAERPTGLSDGNGQPAGRRFDVYRNNVTVSLSEALESAFPVIRKLVGAENFKVLARAFLHRHPPTSPLMMFYGAEMPGFLRDFEPTGKTGYLPDVARLELLIRESYHAADAEVADPNRLQELSPDALMETPITLAPSIRLLRSPWPVFSIWRFNMENGAPKPEMKVEDVLVARPDLDPAPYLLPPGGGAFVEALLAGKTFGAAIDAATEDFDLSATLGLLIETNAMTRIGG